MQYNQNCLTGILPFIALSYMNLHIFLKIRQSRQVIIWRQVHIEKYFSSLQILSGRQSDKRQSEANLAVTLLSIVVMHILCNALRVFLGVLVVALVGQFIIKLNSFLASLMHIALLNE